MQTLAFIVYCLLLMALVIGGLIHDAPTGEQPQVADKDGEEELNL